MTERDRYVLLRCTRVCSAQVGGETAGRAMRTRDCAARMCGARAGLARALSPPQPCAAPRPHLAGRACKVFRILASHVLLNVITYSCCWQQNIETKALRPGTQSRTTADGTRTWAVTESSCRAHE